MDRSVVGSGFFVKILTVGIMLFVPVLAAAYADGAELIKSRDDVDFCDFELNGVIVAGDFEEFMRVEPESLCLDSDGGSFSEVVKILRSGRSFSTVVRRDSRCLSACAILFLGGRGSGLTRVHAQRTIERGAILGFHSPYINSDQEKLYSGAEVEELFSISLEVSKLLVALNLESYDYSGVPIISDELLFQIFNNKDRMFVLSKVFDFVISDLFIESSLSDASIASFVNFCVNGVLRDWSKYVETGDDRYANIYDLARRAEKKLNEGEMFFFEWLNPEEEGVSRSSFKFIEKDAFPLKLSEERRYIGLITGLSHPLGFTNSSLRDCFVVYERGEFAVATIFGNGFNSVPLKEGEYEIIEKLYRTTTLIRLPNFYATSFSTEINSYTSSVHGPICVVYAQSGEEIDKEPCTRVSEKIDKRYAQIDYYVWPTGNKTIIVVGHDEAISINGVATKIENRKGYEFCALSHRTGNTFCYKQ